MKARTLAIALAAALSLGANLSFAAAEAPAGHHHHAEAPTKISLNDGRKWETDAALRTGMEQIRSAIESKSGAIHAGTLPPSEYRALGERLEQGIGYIVVNCKLDPAADANLHVVLGELMGAASAMRQASTQGAPDAAVRAVNAVNAYGRHFDHPGWNAL